jgi:ligand-binding sensor domain-containing protein/signal transduction histidine kinase
MEFNEIVFDEVHNHHLLSQKTINEVIQDEIGYMWIGTQDGLNRYDGKNFKVFKRDHGNADSIQENYISTLFLDSLSRLWIGSPKSGITYLDRMTDKFVRDPGFVDLERQYINVIEEDSSMTMWIGTFGGGLYRKNHYANKCEWFDIGNYFSKEDVSMEYVNCLFYDSDSELLYIGTWNEGLFVFDTARDRLIHHKHSIHDESSVSDNRIRFVYKDSRNQIWVGTFNGLNKYNKITSKFDRHFLKTNSETIAPENNLMSIAEDKFGNLWIGTRSGGLTVLLTDGEFKSFNVKNSKSIGFKSNYVFTTFVDLNNVVWIGTMGEGLMTIDMNRKRFYSILKSHNSEEENYSIRCLNKLSDGRILAGTFENGLYEIHLNGNGTASSRPNCIDDKTVLCLATDTAGNVWSYSQKLGLCKHPTDNLNNPKVFEGFDLIDNIIFGLKSDPFRSGKMWVGFKYDGLRVFFEETGKLDSERIPPALKDVEVKSMMFDNNNNLWIGTRSSGTIVMSLNNEILKIFTESEEPGCRIPDNTVWTMLQTSDGYYWLGTSNCGLVKIDPELKVKKVYDEKSGLCNNCIFGLLEDSIGNIWISTNSGLSKFSIQQETFTNYLEKDGLQSDEFNEGAYFKSPDGTMYFGGINGITYFKPEEIKDNPYIPNIVLTEFEIFNKPVIPTPDNPFLKKNITYADEINLTYRESVFSFGFASLIFNNPQKNQYAYKMEGFDKDWTYCGNRKRVTYTNLNPGQYIFRVKGSNNDGIWNEEGTSIKINISPPYWKTWWFRTLGAVAAIAATGLTYKQRLEKMEREKHAQEEFSRRLIESQEDERKRVSSELHHTVAHDVLIAKNKAQMALKHKDDAGKMEQALREITDLAASTMKDVRNISYNLHPHQLEQLGFTKALKSIITEVSKSTEINFQSEIDDVDKLLTKEYEINLFRAIQESVSNVLKDSFLKVSRSKDFVFIVLSDNGKGFDTKNYKISDKKNGLGIKNISERIKLMKGEYKIESNPGKGTTVVYKIPIKGEK